jgi:hypothetical protein
MALLPATGSALVMGRVYTSYTNTTASGNSNIKLSATLGPQKGKSAGTTIAFSSTFGGSTTPYSY